MLSSILDIGVQHTTHEHSHEAVAGSGWGSDGCGTQTVVAGTVVLTLTTSELASQVAGGLGEGAQELGAVGAIPG